MAVLDSARLQLHVAHPNRSARKQRALPLAHRDHAQAHQGSRLQVEHRILHLRIAVRYGLRAPVKFSWEGPHRSRLQGEGMSRDVSVAGAFVLTPTCPPIGTTLQLEISLPPLYGSTPTVRLKGKARVLRIERAAEGKAQSGFAVVSRAFTMEELERNKGEQ